MNVLISIPYIQTHIYSYSLLQELHLSLRMNLTSALHTSLLLLPDKFNEAQLFMTIASLSYTGDFRFVFLFLICCTPCVNFI
jgi:Phosphatidate cytidylyltransferase, mitochondrial